MNARALIGLFLHLEQMEKAGVPLRQSLQAACDDADDRDLKKALPLMIEELKAGRTLSEAMGFYPRVFDVTLRRLVALGERAGKMGLVLGRARDYLKRNEEQRSMMKRALLYPKISGVIILGLAAWRHDTNMPLLAGCFFCCWAALKLSRYFMPVVKSLTDRVILGIPVIGKFSAQYSFSCFAESLATLFDAGVPLRQALPVAAQSAPNLSIRYWLEGAADQVAAGQSLFQSFQNGRMEKHALSMLKAGETTGNLSGPLREVAAYYDRRLNDAMTALHQMTGPVLTVILGALLYLTR